MISAPKPSADPSGTAGSVAALVPRAFVGRARELGELVSGLHEALTGRGGLYLVVGEPGIGKTRLCEEFALRSAQRGVQAYWGRAWEGGGAPAYWPWTQILRSLLQERGLEALAGVEPNARLVASLLGEPEAGTPDRPVGEIEDPESARFALFDAVTRLLCRFAAERPLVLVLEDLHAADPSSLLLLAFFARELHGAGVLVVGTYRPAEARLAPAVERPLAKLAGVARRLPLHGLAAPDVAEFIESTTGSAAANELVARVHERSDGNPFFLDEILREMLAAGSFDAGRDSRPYAIPLPDGVRQAISRRLDALPEKVRELLQMAAVFGREISIPLLERVNNATVHDEITSAVRADVIREGSCRPGVFEFAHSLIRDVLYEGIAPLRRADLHRRVALALEAFSAEHHLTALAHHWGQAALLPGALDLAIAYCTRAAEQALGLLAYEEAARGYQRVFDLHAARADADRATRCDLLLKLSDACVRAGDAGRARDAALGAADTARAMSDARRLAAAALALSRSAGALWFVYRQDDLARRLLEEALGAVAEAERPLRVRLLAALAIEYDCTYAIDRARDLAREAVALAEQIGDHALCCVALAALQRVLAGPDHLAEREGVVDELFAVASAAGDREMAFVAHQGRLYVFLARGDIARVDDEIEACGRIADDLRQSGLLWQVRSMWVMRAIFDGRLRDAERFLREAFDLAAGTQGGGAGTPLRLQQLGILLFSGRLEEAEPLTRLAPRESSWAHLWRAASGAALVLTGRPEEAREILQWFAVDDFTSIPRDAGWFATMANLVVIAAALGDRERCLRLYRLWLPYAGRQMSCEFVFTGPAGAILGVLAGALGRSEEAERHFDRAIADCRRLGARTDLALTLLQAGSTWALHGGEGKRQQAKELLEESREIATALGAKLLVGYATRLLQGLEAAAGVAEARPEKLPPSVFRREGEYWSIEHAGTAIRLRDSKGIGDLAILLARPGEAVHVADLMAASEGVAGYGRRAFPEEGASTTRFPGGPVEAELDARARREIRNRVAEIREELPDVEERADAGRMERLREELETLSGALAGAYARRGSGDPVERARKAVRMRLVEAFERIDRLHPELGRHLRCAVRTGTFCTYVPVAGVRWVL